MSNNIQEKSFPRTLQIAGTKTRTHLLSVAPPNALTEVSRKPTDASAWGLLLRRRSCHILKKRPEKVRLLSVTLYGIANVVLIGNVPRETVWCVWLCENVGITTQQGEPFKHGEPVDLACLACDQRFVVGCGTKRNSSSP